MFLSLQDDSIKVYTDLKYNPYLSYYKTIKELAKWLKDAVFYVIQDEENDMGQFRYMADRYEIKNGQLSFSRVLSGFGINEESDSEDFELFLRSVNQSFGERDIRSNKLVF